MRRVIKLIAAVAVVIMTIALVIFTLGVGGIFVGALATFSTYMFTSLMVLGAAVASYLGVACFSPSSAKEGSDAVVEIIKRASSNVGEIGGAIGGAVGAATGNAISTLAGGMSRNLFPVLLLCGTGIGAFLIYRNLSSTASSVRKKNDESSMRYRRSISSIAQKHENTNGSDISKKDVSTNSDENLNISRNDVSINDDEN